MHDAGALEIREHTRHAARNLGERLGTAARVDHRARRRRENAIHHEERPATAGRAEVVNANESGMNEIGEELELEGETRAPRLVLEVFQSLESANRAREQIADLEDLVRPRASDRPQDFIASSDQAAQLG